MAKKWLQYWNSRMFRRLLLSFGGFAFLILNLTLISSYRRVADNMRAEEVRLLENRMYTIAEDLNQQTEAMRIFVTELANEPAYDPGNLSKGAYSEIQFLERLHRYNGVTQISDFYFVKYRFSDNIYTSSSKLMDIEHYFGLKLQIDDYSEELELIQSLYETEQNLVLHRMEETVLFLYPLQKYRLNAVRRSGVVGFQVTQRELLERMNVIAGEINGEVVIYYNDFCIFGQEAAELESGDWILAQSGGYRIHVKLDEETYFSWKNVFTYQELTVIGGLLLVVLIAGVVVINWNYVPIKKITEKYALATDEAPDWSHIEEALDNFLQSRERDKERLNMQYRLLREQIIRRIISGDHSEKLQKWMTMLDIELHGSWFSIICCMFSADIVEEKNEICENVEDLSDDEYQLYSFWEDDNTLSILISSQEEYSFEEVGELLESLMESRGLNVTIEIKEHWNGLVRQPSEKTADTSRASKKEICEKFGVKECSESNNKTAKRALAYIKEHCTEYNLTLEAIAEEVQVTSAHLCKIIKKEAKMNYKEYLTTLRMEEAKKLLLSDDRPVMDICHQVGYINISYFIKLFQKHTGMTPAKYREHRGEDI